MKSFILLFTSIHMITAGSAAHRCFCQVTGTLDDCACDVETIDKLNNRDIFPKLQKLLSSDYFRFYKVNLNNPCPFWTDHSQCGLKYCAVKPCTPSEVPEGLKSSSYKYSAEASQEIEECEKAEKLGAINGSLSEETRQALQEWKKHDDESDRFCMLDGQGFYHWLEGLCVEKRAFFRLISGLHASINIHLSARYLLDVLSVLSSFFAGNNKEAMKLKEDFKITFKNISRSMDCVECFKCRLWGKLQTQGLGTALKILFSERQIETMPNTSKTNPSFQLSQQEIVSLFNAFGRISTSVRELKNFRSLLSESDSD
ncbi:ERO1-like protein alpha [Myxocyprinus asiaticus]|uniref:ERO1-like protein alpha n=1 Tax=Myxocyprinus asiaticus TaxID=70543 RepID=UPI0022227B8F|nr:ERO1-like protein alpha [Myxocyprinus asiaticus]